MILLTGMTDGYVQLITVLLLFVVVLGVTSFTTRWIASYQRQQNVGGHVEVVETTRIAGGKYIQILRVGETYMVIAVCKDTVTMLGEITREQLGEGKEQQVFSFKELFDRTVRKHSAQVTRPEGNQVDEER